MCDDESLRLLQGKRTRLELQPRRGTSSLVDRPEPRDTVYHPDLAQVIESSSFPSLVSPSRH